MNPARQPLSEEQLGPIRVVLPLLFVLSGAFVTYLHWDPDFETVGSVLGPVMITNGVLMGLIALRTHREARR